MPLYDEIEYEELLQAKSDRDSFKWHGMRMMKVLEKLIEFDTNPDHLDIEYLQELRFLQFAAKVVCGKEVDWDNKLVDFFKEAVNRPKTDGHGDGDFDE